MICDRVFFGMISESGMSYNSIALHGMLVELDSSLLIPRLFTFALGKEHNPSVAKFSLGDFFGSHDSRITASVICGGLKNGKFIVLQSS